MMLNLSLPNRHLLFSVLAHVTLGCTAFYFMTSLNNIEPFIRDSITQSFVLHYNHTLSPDQLDWVYGAVGSIFYLGAFCGALILKFMCEYFGRRTTLMVIRNILLIVSSVLHACVKPFLMAEFLFPARFLAGVAVSLQLFLPVFVSEYSPTEMRGAMSLMIGVGFRLWCLIGSLVTLPSLLGTERLWPFALLLPVVPSVLHLLLTPLVPESPKHLCITMHDEVKAKESIEYYYGSDVNLDRILSQFRHEAQLTSKCRCIKSSEVLNTKHLLYPLILSILANTTIPMGGTHLAMQYSTSVMQTLGVAAQDAPLFTVLFVQSPMVIFALCCSLLSEKLGRKFLLLAGYSMSVLGTAALFVSGLVGEGLGGILSVVGFSAILWGVSFGPTAIAVLLVGELVPQSIRSLTAALSFGCAWLTSSLLILAFQPLFNAIGSFALLPLTLYGIGLVIVLLLFLPETKGKTVEQISLVWFEKPPAVRV